MATRAFSLRLLRAAAAAEAPAERRSPPPPASALEPLVAVAFTPMVAFMAVRLALHAAFSLRGYGFSVDELYFLDLARHPAWGYVDCPPLVALYARAALALGGSLAAVRLLPALAGAAEVALAMLLARELGGARYAQILTGLTVALCPGFIAMTSYLSMNAFEPLFWTGVLLALARILRGESRRSWIVLGLLLGLGLENKYTTAFFVAALLAAMLLTSARGLLLRPPAWAAAAIALALVLPNLIWQAAHGFPTLTFLAAVRGSGKNLVLGPLAFAGEQIVDLLPFYFPFWLAGLVWLLRARRWRVFGLAFLALYAALELLHGKSYYLFPIFPVLFAAGALAAEAGLRTSRRWPRVAFGILLALAAPVAMPLALPVLEPARLPAYRHAIRLGPHEAEAHYAGPLPQAVSEQLGWPELVRDVAALYQTLPPAERVQTAILAADYGEAGAIDEFGPALGLPAAYSPHLNYWFWGPPPARYVNFILLRADAARIAAACPVWRSVPHYAALGLPEENGPIYYCQGARFNLAAAWTGLRQWR